MTASPTTSSRRPESDGGSPPPRRLDYRFLARPRWIALHLLFVVIVAGMITAGLWQLSRLEDKRERNRLLDERAATDTVDVDVGFADAAALGAEEARDRLEWRPATATGTYRPAEEVLVRNRSLDGAPGAWVLTPLDVGGGRAVVVNRGWVPAPGVPELPAAARAPEGRVTVAGLLAPPEERGPFGPTDPAEGRLETLARVDLERLGEQVDADLYPLTLRLEGQDPPPGELPVPLAEPERREGPHLSYAGQWFLFSLIAAIGYPLLIRRSARQRAVSGLGEGGPGAAEPGRPAGSPPGGEDRQRAPFGAGLAGSTASPASDDAGGVPGGDRPPRSSEGAPATSSGAPAKPG